MSPLPNHDGIAVVCVVNFEAMSSTRRGALFDDEWAIVVVTVGATRYFKEGADRQEQHHKEDSDKKAQDWCNNKVNKVKEGQQTEKLQENCCPSS